MRTQADLVDQLFNSSEKAFGENSLVDGIRQTREPETLISQITQETPSPKSIRYSRRVAISSWAML
jgi:hypothetical protein